MTPVVVIGGGFAGLSAAAALADRGVQVVVVDARPRLGGRATAFRDRSTGEIVDNGQHVMFGCYRETLIFLRRIGAMRHVRVQDTLEVPFVDEAGRRSILKSPALPAPFHLLAGLLGWSALPLRDRLSAVRLVSALKRRNAVSDAKGTVAGWLRTHGQTERIVKWLWEPLAVAALNQPITDAAAAPFVRVLSDLFAADPRAASLVLPATPLDRMYADPARAFIEARQGEVRTNALARVTTDDARVTGVQLRDELIQTDRVISTVPWHQLEMLFDRPPDVLEDILSRASSMRSMPIVTVNLWYDRIVMDEAFAGLPGRSMQWVFDKRRAFGESASHLSLVSSAAASLASVNSDELIGVAAREIAAAFPRARSATLTRGTVIREKQATFSLSPGQPARPGTITPLKGFYLAGDWTDTGLPGTIESAVLSGHRAADRMLKAEG